MLCNLHSGNEDRERIKGARKEREREAVERKSLRACTHLFRPQMRRGKVFMCVSNMQLDILLEASKQAKIRSLQRG